MKVSYKTCLVISAAVVALGLGGCKHGEQGTQVAGWALVDPAQRHPILVTQQPVNLSLHVAKGSQGLSPSQKADVADFTSRFRASDAGNSRLIISTPAGSANEGAAMDAVDDVRQILSGGGFSESSIIVETYQSDSSGQPPLRISYMRYVAEGPTCGHDWSENLASDPRNLGHPNLGCSNQRNLAAMIANPADLLGPRGQDQRSAARRDKVFEKWTAGQVTASEKTEDERVRVRGAN